MRVHSLSIYDGAGDVLWLSEGALGPDEHSVVVDGMDTLRSGENKLILTRTLDDGRSAILLAVRAPRGDLVGLVMILADPKSLKGEAPMQSVTAPLRATLQKIARQSGKYRRHQRGGANRRCDELRHRGLT